MFFGKVLSNEFSMVEATCTEVFADGGEWNDDGRATDARQAIV